MPAVVGADADAEPAVELTHLFLWPHSGCNCRCAMCDIWLDRSRRTIDPADVEEWAKEWERLGVRFVSLTGGEALMHREIWRIAAILRDHGIRIALMSTGITLARHAEAAVRHCGLVVVSLDGPPQVHDAVRRIPNAHRKLAEGVAELRRHRPSFPVFGRCAVHRLNFRHLRETVEFSRQLELTRLSFLATDVTSEAFNRPSGWAADRQEAIALASDDLPELEEELDRLEAECRADFESGLIMDPPQALRTKLLGFYRAHNGLGEFPPVRCNAPWASAVVEVDGTVRPCFFHEPYGNVHEAGSLEAVLASPKAVAFRRELDVRTNPICRRCVCPQTYPRHSETATPSSLAAAAAG